MAVNQKSATLPANLRHTTTTESKESGGFFSKLKKRFRLRKGNYDIGVNTGECENISTVSFKKRESREGLSDVLRLSPGSTHKDRSPLSRRPHRSHSDAVSPEKLKIKTTISPKHKRLEDQDDVSKTPKAFDLNNEPKRSSSLKYEAAKANEYSCIQFQNDAKARKPLDLESENIKNDCLTVDDSAVDLDDDIAEPGYESLNEVKQRILSKDFSSDRKSERTRNLSEPHSVQVKHSQRVGENNACSKTLDDSALSLVSTETSLHSSIVDPLTSSSKSRDSGFESSKTQNSPDNLPNIIAGTNTVDADEDEDDELRLDPAYAECADAIKGTLPFAAYSEGSGSKLSSCQSLDATADDIEPDYAECADALKSGSVRMRISVSNERLADQDKSAKTKSKEHIKKSSSSEVYANPQILFKKRSKVLVNDRSSGEFSNRSSDTDRNESFTFSSSESLQKDLKEERSSSQAPPLPARNYSLYLENEEAAQILTDDNSPPSLGNTNSGCVDANKIDLSQIDDNAFEDFGYSSVKETNEDAIVKTLEDSSFSHSANKNIIDQSNEDFDENHFSCSVNYTKANESVDILDFGYASVDDMKAAKQFEENKFMQKNGKYVQKETNFGSSSISDTKGSDFKLFDKQKNAVTEMPANIDSGDFGYATVKEASNQSTRINSIVRNNEPVTSNIITKDEQEDELIDFGYASVKDTKIKTSENTVGSKETLTENTKQFDANEGEPIDFGYASVKETSCKSAEFNMSRKETCISDTKEDSSHKENKIDFGYASVKDTKRKDVKDLADSDVKVSGNSVGEISLQYTDKETETVVSNSNLINRNSFEVKKMEYIRTLEEDFGYSTVNSVKRKSDVLPESEVSENPSTHCKVTANISERFKQTINANSEDIGFSSMEKDSKDTSDTCATEQTMNSKEKDCRSQLTLETCNCSFDQIEGRRNIFDTGVATSPVSEVVSSGFLCSTPLIKDEKDTENISDRSSSAFDENSLEVTILDKSGSCRVLKIIEKEEPTALVEKRKSVRSSQKGSVKKSEDEKISEQSIQEKSLVSTDTCSQQEVAHGHQTQSLEREERKHVTSATSEITESEKNCAKELQIEQSDISEVSGKDKPDVELVSDQNIAHNVIVSTESLENLPKDNNLEPAQNVKISYQESTNFGYDDLKLPVRSNIQKVSYRSVTDSDSDDCDLKLENLPKLVIDESVFDDSDSSDNVNCSKNESKSEVAEAISNLTEQIEKELNPSEEVSEPIHMTLEEVLKEEPSFTQVQSADSYSNSVSFAVNEAKNFESENVHKVAKTVISKGKFDEQNEHVQKERDFISESDSIISSVHLEEPNLNIDSNLHLNIGEPEVTCQSRLADAGHPDQNCSAVPPRPPPPVCLSSAKTGKTDSGNDSLEGKAIDTHQDGINSDSGQSDQQSPSSDTSDRNPDQLPIVFRPGSGSSQSDVHDDDSPPAIPPRVRIRKPMREASSCYKDFMESMRQLKDVGWYWGPLIWEEAEAKLANKAEGSFLVRDSSDERYILSLSFKHQGRVHHTRIEHHRGQFSFWSQPESHGKSTIKDFIEQCVDNSRNGRFLYFIRPSAPGAPPLPIHLLHPVSRFAQMRSLQHMCRFAILQMVRRDHIDDLPVPTRIKKYLQEAQYYVEYLED